MKYITKLFACMAAVIALTGVSAATAWGQTTYSFSSIPTTGWSATNGGSQTINSVTWTYSQATYLGVNGGKIQIGSKNSPQTNAWTIQTPISSFGDNVTITAVSIIAYTTATTATYDISVGGSSVKSGSLTTSSSTYSAENLSVNSGNIVVTMTGSSISKAMYLSDISVTYSTGGTVTPTCATPAFSPAQGTYTSAQNVTISTETEGATIYYTLDGTAPTVNSSVYSSAISVSETTTIKAIAVKDGNNNSAVASATYTILEHAGTEADPYTVADARAAIDANSGITNVYATGIVSQVDSYNSTYNSITYWISSDGTTTSDQLEVYSGKGLNNSDFSSKDDVEVGATVVVYGTLKKYNTTYEFDKNNYLKSYTAPVPTVATPNFSPAAGAYTTVQNVEISTATDGAAIYYTTDGSAPTTGSNLYSVAIPVSTTTTIKAFAVKDGMTDSEVAEATYTINLVPSVTPAAYTVEATAAGKEGTINVTYDNITTVAADVAFFESDGTTDATYDWIVASVNDSNNVEYLIEENTSSEARSAYMKVWAYDDDLNEVYSELITFTQAGFVVDYATLPFEYDGNGQSTLPTGFTVDGLGTYSSSPKMQFNSSGDWAILKINEAPGKLTFDIKGNSFSGGTFKVQTSADGTTYTDLETYTELGSTQSEEFDNLASTVRYIKWVYTNKSSGNVALGNIKLAKVDSTPAIVLSTNSVEASAAETDGTITVTYKNITDIAAEVKFYEADGETVATYDWLEAKINAQNNVDYVIDANIGAARTAYLKVYALDDEANDVFSELVTISQEAYVAPVAETTWVKTELSDLTSDDVFLIVGDNGSTYAMSNDNGTSNPPAAVAVDVENNTITAAIADNLQWTIGGNAEDGYTFYVNGSDSWLYCTSTNNGVRVGSNANKTFVIDDGYLKHEGTSRYVGIYNSSDWRCYTTINDNIKDQTFSFYKKAAPQGVESAITLTATLSGGRYWATFYNSDAQYRITNGAQAFTMNEDHELYLLGEDGSVIPAGKAVIIISDTDNVTLTLKNAAGSVTVNGGDNILRGSNSAVAKTGSQYVLGIVDGTLGFYKFTGDYIPANKAYYVVTE